MSRIDRRYVGGTVAFGLAAVWVVSGPLSALGCVLAGCAGFVFVAGLERIGPAQTSVPNGTRVRRGTPHSRRPRSGQRPRPVVEHDPEPVAATLVDAATYGW